MCARHSAAAAAASQPACPPPDNHVPICLGRFCLVDCTHARLYSPPQKTRRRMFHVKQFHAEQPQGALRLIYYFPIKIGKNNIQQRLDIDGAGQLPQSARGQPQVFGGQLQPALSASMARESVSCTSVKICRWRPASARHCRFSHSSAKTPTNRR